MRFHVGEEIAENYKKVVGGPWPWKITEAEEMDNGMKLQCTAQEGEFAGKWVGHFLSTSEKSEAFVKQFLLVIDYPGADGVGDLDVNVEGLLDSPPFIAKARVSRRNEDFSELYDFYKIDEEGEELRP